MHYIKTCELPEQVMITEMDDASLANALKECKIALTVEEARKLPKILGRNPTLTEAIIWGIQGSEHCSYRSSRKFLKQLPTSGPTVILGPSEDSGIVEIANENGKKWGIIISHESHNHPSQVVPYEGAATGIGGNIRDILCMGGRPIATADPLRFGAVSGENTDSKCKVIANDVIAGIAGYGNPIGVPCIAGDTYFNESFNENCLVNVVALGVLSEDEIIHSFVPKDAAKDNYDIIIVGKPTDNSGMGGASFASADLKEEDKETNKGAVQEPNPFLKRHIIESTCDLFKTLKAQGDLDKVGFKDMGAGGNVCATVEQVERVGLGAQIDISKVHTSMENLHPSVIACSETQERLCWTCHPKLTQQILDHYNKKWDLPKVSMGAKASLVGKVTEGNFILKYKDQILVDAKPSDITEGLRYDREYTEPVKNLSEPARAALSFVQLNEDFLGVISHENVCSRKPIYEKYDKVVQGLTKIQAGQADAGVIQPLRNRADASTNLQKVGASLTVDSNPKQSRISPYWSAYNAVCEGVRNTCAVGAHPIAFTDCLNYGNPEKPEQMWEFVEGVRGIAEAAKAIMLKEYPNDCLPCVSGNVSFYNGTEKSSVDASAVISTLGKITDASKAITMKLKEVGSSLYLVGERKDELGASVYYEVRGKREKWENSLGANVPKADAKQVYNESYAVVDLIDSGAVLSAHDISDGGLVVALAEMCMGGDGDGEIGVECSVNPGNLPFDTYLFSETGGFVLEVKNGQESAVEKLLSERGVYFEKLGKTTSETLDPPTYSAKFEVKCEGSNDLRISADLGLIKASWLNPLRSKLV